MAPLVARAWTGSGSSSESNPTVPPTAPIPEGLAVLGVGVDVVHIPSFVAQLEVPGSRFVSVFSAAERRAAEARGRATGLGSGPHLAGRWAVKEAVIKAWSQACVGQAPWVAEIDAWRLVEVRSDAWGRVVVVPHGALRAWGEGENAWGCGLKILASLSHDGDYAVATAVVAMNPD